MISQRKVLLRRCVVCVSRTPAALVQSGGSLICHKSAEANYQQLLSDHAPENMDNPCS